jgi:hypothetical protein
VLFLVRWLKPTAMNIKKLPSYLWQAEANGNEQKYSLPSHLWDGHKKT